MKRVLVPLDGSSFAESIIPDARRLAGRDGQLILVHDASHPRTSAGSTDGEAYTIPEREEYLETVARRLREEHVQVDVHTTFLNDIPFAIDAAAEMFHADAIACSTHGRTVVGRLVRGGAAWQALAGSKVPVLLHHDEDHDTISAQQTWGRRIMVPLDGSHYAEKALPLAQELARDWNAGILLAYVIAGTGGLMESYGTIDTYALHYEDKLESVTTYLNDVAGKLGGDVKTRVLTGSIVEGLAGVAQSERISDIVMASHGRTGLSRVILGSVADSLIHRLHLPILVMPALAVGAETAAAEPALAHGQH